MIDNDKTYMLRSKLTIIYISLIQKRTFTLYAIITLADKIRMALECLILRYMLVQNSKLDSWISPLNQVRPL